MLFGLNYSKEVMKRTEEVTSAKYLDEVDKLTTITTGFDETIKQVVQDSWNGMEDLHLVLKKFMLHQKIIGTELKIDDYNVGHSISSIQQLI